MMKVLTTDQHNWTLSIQQQIHEEFDSCCLSGVYKCSLEWYVRIKLKFLNLFGPGLKFLGFWIDEVVKDCSC